MFDVEELLKQQLEQITVKKKAKGVQLSASTGISYNAKLQKMLKEVKKDIDRELIPLVRGFEKEYVADRWGLSIAEAMQRLKGKWLSDFVSDIALDIASNFIGESDRVNGKRFNESMASFGLNIYGDSVDLSDLLTIATRDNVRLIKSIPERYLNDVESIVLSNVRAGNRSGQIVSLLRDRFHVSKNRAKLIARDQTSKINSNLTKMRQQAVGFEFFEWIDVDDERVRHRHSQISKRKTKYGIGVYRWDDLPKNNKGQRISPGDDYQCRCFARPVSNAEAKRNQQARNS